MILKIALGVLGLCLLTAGTLCFVFFYNYIRYSPLLKSKTKVNPVLIDSVNSDAIAKKLSDFIRCKTVSSGKKPTDNTDAAFEAMRNALLENYPNIHRVMQTKMIDNSLVYHWQGKSSESHPVLFLAHQDVVEANSDGWEYPPFEGVIENDFLYGRGAIDCKNVIATLFEAVEVLITEGFQPENDFYFAFGHDEELGGREGAGKIVEYFKRQDILFEAVYDEGGYIALDMKDFIAPVALVATSEKGLMNVLLTARSPAGHASRPTDKNAIEQLAEAVTRMKKYPLPYRIVPTNIDALHRSIHYLTGRARFVVSNLWFFRSIFFKSIADKPLYNALFRTTLSPTMLRAGVSHNILPGEANVIVNIRVLEGDTQKDIESYLSGILEGLDITFDILLSDPPSQVSSADSRAFRVVERVIYDVFGEIPILPISQPSASDARRFEAICRNVIRFSPMQFSMADFGRMHGANERIRIKTLGRATEFYKRLITATSDRNTVLLERKAKARAKNARTVARRKKQG